MLYILSVLLIHYNKQRSIVNCFIMLSLKPIKRHVIDAFDVNLQRNVIHLSSAMTS